ncbi:MAG: hypothetical protein P4M09_32445 [Devosia sp.]|nr:hypothetical protein [Devosia sp.]
MRMMLRATFDVEAANLAINDGSVAAVFDKVFAVCPPEATYFTTEDGKRALYAFIDLKSVEQMPMITEPMFQAFGASVDLKPVMTPDDLAKGLSAYAASK